MPKCELCGKPMDGKYNQFGKIDWLCPNDCKFEKACEVLREVSPQELAEDAKREELIVAHKRFITAHKLQYDGTRSPTTKSHRTPNCYECRKHLDNSIDLECIKCGWIICTCGACGCGYK